jgi:hypothetical protein
VGDVLLRASDEIVEGKDFVPVGQQAITQVGTDETCGA